MGAVKFRDARIVQGCVSSAVVLKLGGSSVTGREIKSTRQCDAPV